MSSAADSLADTAPAPSRRTQALWLLAALGIAALGTWWVGRANDPGRQNVDATHQFRQALGLIGFDDWHPAIMSGLWRLTIEWTGSVATLMWLQIVVTWLGAVALGWALLRATGSRIAATAVLGVPALPWVVDFLGTMFKDTQMMAGLFAGTALVVLAATMRRRGVRWALLVPAMVLLVYATVVRKNAIFATLPLVWLWLAVAWGRAVWGPALARATDSPGTDSPGTDSPGTDSPGRPRHRWRAVALVLAATMGFGAAVVGTDKAVNTALDVTPTNQLAQVYLDDIVFVLSTEEIRQSSLDPVLKKRVIEARWKCRKEGAIWNAYWRCFGRGRDGQPFTAIPGGEQLGTLWWDQMPRHLPGYLTYRTRTMAEFLLHPRVPWWDARWGTEWHELGGHVTNRRADRAMAHYVNTTSTLAPWVFAGLTWLLASLALLLAAWRWLRLTRWPVLALAASAALYLLGWFPVAPDSQYRYVYWSATAVTAALVLVAAEVAIRWRRRRRAGEPAVSDSGDQ